VKFVKEKPMKFKHKIMVVFVICVFPIATFANPKNSDAKRSYSGGSANSQSLVFRKPKAEADKDSLQARAQLGNQVTKSDSQLPERSKIAGSEGPTRTIKHRFNQ
jgi:hypothetical protein